MYQTCLQLAEAMQPWKTGEVRVTCWLAAEFRPFFRAALQALLVSQSLVAWEQQAEAVQTSFEFVVDWTPPTSFDHRRSASSTLASQRGISWQLCGPWLWKEGHAWRGREAM